MGFAISFLILGYVITYIPLSFRSPTDSPNCRHDIPLTKPRRPKSSIQPAAACLPVSSRRESCLLGRGRPRCSKVVRLREYLSSDAHPRRYRFGVSGSYWYASGAVIQVLLFAMLASKLKMNAPYCHTLVGRFFKLTLQLPRDHPCTMGLCGARHVLVLRPSNKYHRVE
jgi:hypothetical protein